MINSFKFHNINNLDYYIFYDIFLHKSGNKITAVSPFYNDEIDINNYYDPNDIKLVIDNIEIIGEYIPFGLNGWEPCILYDFKHDIIKKLALTKEYINIKIIANKLVKEFKITTNLFEEKNITVATCSKNENKWVPIYLNYYLKILNVDYIYLYDNNDDIIKQNELKSIVNQFKNVIYIPWYFRWKNKRNRQIGQPPQEAHTLNKFKNKWLGFFDTDEFLFIHDNSIENVLDEYDYNKIKAISFENKWCMYKGTKKYEEIINPLLEFKYTRKNPNRRRLQKLFVNSSKVRFCRFHWISEILNSNDCKIANSKDETQNNKYFYYHYFIRKFRFNEGVNGINIGNESEFDDKMSNFILDILKSNPFIFEYKINDLK